MAPAKKKTPAQRKTTTKAKPKATPKATAKGGPRRKVPNPHTSLILDKLAELYPRSECALVHHNPFQLLISTILSAQCTDVRVNQVTQTLFQDYPDPKAFAEATQEEIEEQVHSTGFYRNKAKNIRAASQDILDKHRGKVPDTMKELSALAGVGRKTANVVLGNIWNKPDGVVVDTHVKRLGFKLALTNNTDPVKIERDLNELVPYEQWVIFSHRVIDHGRAVCNARSPKCDNCTLYPYCPTRG